MKAIKVVYSIFFIGGRKTKKKRKKGNGQKKIKLLWNSYFLRGCIKICSFSSVARPNIVMRKI